MLLCQEDCPLIRTLGEGAFGRVTLRSIPVAVKEMMNPENALDLLKEQQLMSRLRHHAIPGAMTWMQKRDGTRGLAIQYVDGHSMEQFQEWVPLPLHRTPVDVHPLRTSFDLTLDLHV